MIVKRGELRDHRSHRRFADHLAAGLGRRRLLQRHHAEIRRAGDPQGSRHRLEAAALPQQRVGLGRRGAEARRPRERARHHHRAYLKDPTDPQWENDAGYKDGSPGWTSTIPAATEDRAQRLRLQRGAHHGAGAEAVRRRSDARERDEAGGQPARTSTLPMLLPGITVNTSPTDFPPIEQLQLVKFDGQTWKLFGNVMRGHAEG